VHFNAGSDEARHDWWWRSRSVEPFRFQLPFSVVSHMNEVSQSYEESMNPFLQMWQTKKSDFLLKPARIEGASWEPQEALLTYRSNCFHKITKYVKTEAAFTPKALRNLHESRSGKFSSFASSWNIQTLARNSPNGKLRNPISVELLCHWLILMIWTQTRRR